MRLSVKSLDDVVHKFRDSESLIPRLFSSHELSHIFIVLYPSLFMAHVCDSIFSIAGVPSSDVKERSIQSILVESPVNESFLKNLVRERPSDDSETLSCELKAANGQAIPIAFSVQTIRSEHEVIGYSCLGTRIRCDESASIAAPYLLRKSEDPKTIKERWASLSPSEQEVIMLIVDGVQNKVAASRLGVAVRTIESRRSSAMKKLRIRSVADLVRIYFAINLTSNLPPSMS